MSSEPGRGPDERDGRSLGDRFAAGLSAGTTAWERRAGRLTPRFVVGMAIMTAGLVLALDSLGLADAGAVLRFWPLVLIAIGVVKWLTPPREGSAALVWIVAGAGFLMVVLGLMPITRIWAVVLFFVGANIAWRALRPPRVPSGVEGARFDVMAVLAGVKTVSYSPDFQGGSAVATLGGCEIDLRNAGIPEDGEAAIDTFAFWGGIEIRVPEEWEVVDRGSAFMGGFENKTRPVPGARRRLVVTGTAIMGGVEVKN